MERFVRRENIKRYRALLREATDAAERQRLRKLLAEEEKNGKAGSAAAGLRPRATKPRARRSSRTGKNFFA